MRVHPVEFWLRHDVPAPADPLRTMMQIVSDMNVVFEKNTNRRFVLDNPQIKRVSDFNLPGSFFYPTEEYPVYICMSPGERTGNGWARVHPDGGAMLMMEVDRLHPWTEGMMEMNFEHAFQTHVCIHEAAHNFAVAIGEDYDRSQIDDPTGVDPLVPVDVNNPRDILWSRLSDYASDPMLHLAPRGRFSDHNARVISGSYRTSQAMPPFAPLDQCRVLVTQDPFEDIDDPLLNDLRHDPMRGARVRIWSVDSRNPSCVLLVDATTDDSGVIPFTWPANPHTNDSVLVKCHADGYTPSAGWLTQPDLESAGMDGEHLEAIVRMRRGREESQIITLETVGRLPGVVRILGCVAGQKIEISYGRIGEPPDNFVRMTAEGPDFVWVDTLPQDSISRVYSVRTLPQTGLAAMPAARRLSVDPMARLCRMCAGV